MGQGKPQIVQDLWSSSYDQMKKRDVSKSMIPHEGYDDDHRHDVVDDIDDDSSISNESSSSNDDIDDDDACSTITCSTSSNSSSGALYDLSEIMAQLPIKRGLSQYYNGKSDSFTCLSRVTSLEDLAKKEPPYCRRKKKNKTVGYRLFTLPKPIISKKNTTRGASLSTTSLRRSFIHAGRPPQIPLHKGFNGG